MHVWRAARRFQRLAKRLSQASGISVARWQVLDVTERLTREKDDPVSELEVARAAELAKSTMCELMQGLRLQGLADIGPDAWGASYRIGVTKEGEELVVKLRKQLLEIAGGWLASSISGALPEGRDDF